MFDPQQDPQWLKVVTSVELLDPALAPGARVKRHGSVMGREFSWHTEVEAVHFPHVLTMKIAEGPFTGHAAVRHSAQRQRIACENPRRRRRDEPADAAGPDHRPDPQRAHSRSRAAESDRREIGPPAPLERPQERQQCGAIGGAELVEALSRQLGFDAMARIASSIVEAEPSCSSGRRKRRPHSAGVRISAASAAPCLIPSPVPDVVQQEIGEQRDRPPIEERVAVPGRDELRHMTRGAADRAKDLLAAARRRVRRQSRRPAPTGA